jgi:hypothetical protein
MAASRDASRRTVARPLPIDGKAVDGAGDEWHCRSTCAAAMPPIGVCVSSVAVTIRVGAGMRRMLRIELPESSDSVKHTRAAEVALVGLGLDTGYGLPNARRAGEPLAQRHPKSPVDRSGDELGLLGTQTQLGPARRQRENAADAAARLGGQDLAEAVKDCRFCECHEVILADAAMAVGPLSHERLEQPSKSAGAALEERLGQP